MSRVNEENSKRIVYNIVKDGVSYYIVVHRHLERGYDEIVCVEIEFPNGLVFPVKVEKLGDDELEYIFNLIDEKRLEDILLELLI